MSETLFYGVEFVDHSFPIWGKKFDTTNFDFILLIHVCKEFKKNNLMNYHQFQAL